MNTGKFFLKQFLTSVDLTQLIIPEIQRDYVWNTDNMQDLLNTFLEGYSNESERPYLGFIYAYTDKEYASKYFVVDGQQRLTSIFLILLSCYQLSGKALPSYLYKNENLKLDYKVREATHSFLLNLVKYCNENLGNADFTIENQVWFHDLYRNDPTISNMVKNFYCIRDLLNDEVEDLNDFAKYIETKVQLSYFNIESNREGEELYIYINSRGKQLEVNETLKAKFLERVDNNSKNEWGAKWEQWQDFFWKNRGTNNDADIGFDEFLRRVQILKMCALGESGEKISQFSVDKSNTKIEIEFLPNTMEELEDYFEAFKILVENDTIKAFYRKHGLSAQYFLETPAFQRRQIYYFNILPVLAFVKGSKSTDNRTILRVARFFLNSSRKLNIGKDISSHLPSAIKLIYEYFATDPKSFDIADLRSFTRSRTVLLDGEEVFKFQSYVAPPESVTREELEDLFWSAEDHPVFRGEITFLLSDNFNNQNFDLDLSRIRNWFSTFKMLFPANETNSNNHLIIMALLFYGNTWLQDSPYYYNNYDCADWSALIKVSSGKYLKELIVDMTGRELPYLNSIIESRISAYFDQNRYHTHGELRLASSFLDQIKVLASVDFYAGKLLWSKPNFYFAEDERWSSATYGDTPFFKKDRVLYNTARYIGDGYSNRVIKTLQSVLTDEHKLDAIIQVITTNTNSAVQPA